MLEGVLITAGIMISYWVDVSLKPSRVSISSTPNAKWSSSYTDLYHLSKSFPTLPKKKKKHQFGLYFANHSSVSWRFPIAFQVVFALLIMATVLSLPESPRWLVKQGRIDEARSVFAALDGISDTNHPSISKVIATVQLSLKTDDSTSNNSVKKMFTMGKTRNFHRATLAFFSQCFQQIRSVNNFLHHSTFFFIALLNAECLLLITLLVESIWSPTWVQYYRLLHYTHKHHLTTLNLISPFFFQPSSQYAATIYESEYISSWSWSSSLRSDTLISRTCPDLISLEKKKKKTICTWVLFSLESWQPVPEQNSSWLHGLQSIRLVGSISSIPSQ